MSRKHPPDAKPRMVALLREAAECGGVIRAAGHLKEKNEHVVDAARQLAEKTHAELMGPGGLNATTYNEACRIAAERLEGEQ